jgi:hypothetical protein
VPDILGMQYLAGLLSTVYMANGALKTGIVSPMTC